MSSALTAITAFRLTTEEPEQLARFYEGLGFAINQHEAISGEEIALLGLKQGGTRLRLRLGDQRLDLDSFDEPGRPYPTAARSADLCFQHLALVASDAAAAWTRAAALGATPISARGPVKLPPSAGGILAIKFRDPEGHPLELLQFQPGSGSGWYGAGLLGIDHSAISVANAGASRRYYEALGLTMQNPTVNDGPTQTALDGLPQVVVDVVPMMPRRETPHLELLAYRTPAGRPIGRLEANDVAATRIVWTADRDALLRDPDGHLNLLRREV